MPQDNGEHDSAPLCSATARGSYEPRFYKLVPEALLPTLAYAGDAGLDLRTPVGLTVPAGERAFCDLGLQVDIPAGYVGLLMPRSGLSRRAGITLLNVGVIDSGYAGGLGVTLYNSSHEDYRFEAGDAVAQFLCLPCLSWSSFTPQKGTRGTAGFGSSGN
jgi:dUTP pyrophosphatase